MHRSSHAIRWLIRARGVSLARPVAPPPKVSVTNHLGVGPLKSEAQGDNEVAFGVGKVPWVEVAGRSGVPVRVAGRSDDVPGAGAEGAEGAEGHGLRIEVQLLLLDGLVVAPLLQVTVLVGSERPLRCRLVVKVSDRSYYRY